MQNQQTVSLAQVQHQLALAGHNLTQIFSDLLFIGLVIGIFACLILFRCSLYKTMHLVPKEKRIFPNWFIWMGLIPLINIIFDSMMLPFGIPHGLRDTVPNNIKAVRTTRTLKILGLCMMLIGIFDSIIIVMNPQFLSPMQNVVLTIICIVLVIIYWCKTVSFRKKYLSQSIS
ncbi:MAG: hypothetical protein A2624_00575 [Gammaproteobacteria bacterium RIFCSPHIGHO2_01_FULL_42_8]|nr:MAG: hypothetical protein A2624_00575 [Gammaproteobacteria bacterium RIFCSPHIGHO2_01_FULL_42_8]